MLLLISAESWDALTPEQKQGLRNSTVAPWLGEPAPFVQHRVLDDGPTYRPLGPDEVPEFYGFSDTRWTEENMALVAALIENPNLIPLEDADAT